MIYDCRIVGAGGGNRTRVTSLENWDNSRYTTPADVRPCGNVHFRPNSCASQSRYGSYRSFAMLVIMTKLPYSCKTTVKALSTSRGGR